MGNRVGRKRDRGAAANRLHGRDVHADHVDRRRRGVQPRTGAERDFQSIEAGGHQHRADRHAALSWAFRAHRVAGCLVTRTPHNRCAVHEHGLRGEPERRRNSVTGTAGARFIRSGSAAHGDRRGGGVLHTSPQPRAPDSGRVEGRPDDAWAPQRCHGVDGVPARLDGQHTG